MPFLKAIRDEAQKAADAAQLQATTAEEIERQWAGVAETFENLVPAIRDIRGQLRDIGADDQSTALRDSYGELLKAIDENRASAEDLQKFVDLLKAAQKALGTEGVNPTIEAFEKQAAAITKAKDATQKLTQESEKAQGKLKELHLDDDSVSDASTRSARAAAEVLCPHPRKCNRTLINIGRGSARPARPRPNSSRIANNSAPKPIGTSRLSGSGSVDPTLTNSARVQKSHRKHGRHA